MQRLLNVRAARLNSQKFPIMRLTIDKVACYHLLILNFSSMEAAMTDPAYLELYTMINRLTGLSVDENRQIEVARAVKVILEAEALPDLPTLLDRLRRTPVDADLWRPLIRAVTVGETYFFRNQAHFDVLRRHVLPGLIKERRAAGLLQMRIWSAGCASGEEPYSIAMLLDDLLPDRAQWNITLLGTAFFAAQFIAGPYLGRLSDKIGRLPVLIVSQIGTFIGFFCAS